MFLTPQCTKKKLPGLPRLGNEKNLNGPLKLIGPTYKSNHQITVWFVLIKCVIMTLIVM